jgi:DNA-binding CsgD family transcriptional regulator
MQLSGRQRQILSLLSMGKSNKEVAYELSITEGTVKQHLSVLFKKLQVTNRAKAVIAATEFLANESADNEKHPTSLLSVNLPSNFIWRLVSSVAIYFKTSGIETPAERARFNQAMSDMHLYVQTLADALDGMITIAPGIGMITSFGAPKSHLDDAARAIFLATQVHQWSLTHNELPISIGIATAAEVLADKTNTIYRAESFDMATQLAMDAEKYQILANEVTCRLAGPVVKYSGPRNDQVKKISYREIQTSEALDLKALANKTPLPFIPEVTFNLKNKKAMWVSVNGWPPHSNVRLQDAIGVNLQSQGINTYKLRLPTDATNEEIGKAAYTQLNILARIRQRPEGNEIFLKAAESNTQKLLASIKILTMRGNLAVILYGINSHASLLKVLGEKGLEELANYPVIIVTSSLTNAEESHVTAKILGSIPGLIANPKGYKLPLPTPPIAPHGINADLATLIDNLSENARSIVRYLANKGPIRVIEIGQFVGEVMSTGLFLLESDIIRCRDEETLKTLKMLYLDETK